MINQDDKDNKIAELVAKLKNTEEDIKYLLEQLAENSDSIEVMKGYWIKYKDITGDKNQLKDLTVEVETAKKQANKAKEDAEKAGNEVKDLKTQIFSVMALFFGIFTFISIDLSFTKGIMDRVKYFNNLEFIITFLFIQGLFFVAVYYFLLKPFLNTSNPSTQQSSKVKKIFIIIFLLLLVFLGIVCILNYNSICNYISQKNSIVNNPNSNNTFKATEELKKPPLP